MAAMKFVPDPKTLVSSTITTTHYTTIFDFKDQTSRFMQKNKDGSLAIFSVSTNRYSKRLDTNGHIKEETNYSKVPACEKCSDLGEFLAHLDGICPGQTTLANTVNVPTCKGNLLKIVHVHEPNCGCATLDQGIPKVVKFVPN